MRMVTAEVDDKLNLMFNLSHKTSKDFAKTYDEFVYILLHSINELVTYMCRIRFLTRLLASLPTET